MVSPEMPTPRTRLEVTLSVWPSTATNRLGREPAWLEAKKWSNRVNRSARLE